MEARRHCPICDSFQPVVGLEQSVTNSSARFTMFQCASCHCWHRVPPPAQNELKTYYEDDYYFFDRDSNFEFFRNHELYRRTVRLVDNEIHEKRVLEIGCSKGYLLAILKRIGWQVQGVEISATASSHARSEFDLPIFTGDVEAFAEYNPSLEYPLILALDVLEHVPDPFKFMSAVRQLLSPGAFLIIDTPNAESNSIRSEKGAWKGFNPFHVRIYSRAGLQRLLSVNDLTLHSLYEYSYDPFASQLSSLELRIRTTVKSLLKKTGLFSTAYRYYRNIKMRNEPTKDPLRRVVNRIESERAPVPLFPQELLREKGDNLVLICRKS